MDTARRDHFDETRQVWQPHTSRHLSQEDCRQILENAVGVFQLLSRWASEKPPLDGLQQPHEDDNA